jgi:uncharacterized protein
VNIHNATKLSDSLKTTPSINRALSDLRLQRIDVIHAGEHTFPLAENIRAVALQRLLDDVTLE